MELEAPLTETTLTRREYARLYREEHSITAKEYQLVYRKENRQKAFDLLGGAYCKTCGFSDTRALQFDHINGDGAEHRREIGYAGQATCRAIIKDPDRLIKYQVLCANCNWIKRTVNKEHR